ncbi:MAG: CooT family nickel-binding protein [Bacillota bacterium]|nr:CooT family nickel-binding protein [Bacillota bacterium]
MCEANAYLVREDGSEELLLKAVDKLTIDGDTVYLVDVFGRQERLRARVRSLALVDHKILLERTETP